MIGLWTIMLTVGGWLFSPLVVAALIVVTAFVVLVTGIALISEWADAWWEVALVVLGWAIILWFLVSLGIFISQFEPLSWVLLPS